MKRRMHHLFKEDGRILIVAMDHAGFVDTPMPGMIHPGETIRKVVAGGADVVMTTFGTATLFTEELAGCGLILSASCGSPMGEYVVEAARLVRGAGTMALPIGEGKQVNQGDAASQRLGDARHQAELL